MNAHKKKPKPLGFVSKQEPVEVQIDNPMFSPDHKVGRTNPLKISATINVRESPIGLLAHRGIINKAQVEAAAEFRKLWEAMGGAGVKAMDYSIDPVDGGGIAEPISIRQMDAAKKLRDLRAHIGVRPYDIVSKVVGQGIEITVLGKNKRECLLISNYLKDGLADSATFWGFQTRNSPVDSNRVAS